MSGKTRLILAMAFGLALAAGAVLGVVVSARTVSSAPAPEARRPERGGGGGERISLVRELELTDEQQQKMKEIWSNVPRGGGREHFEQHRALQKQREEAILNLFTPEQKAKYDAIEAEFRKQVESLAQERERAFERAVEETKKILTPRQQAKYDEILKRRREEHERRGGGGGGAFGGPPGPPKSPGQ